MPPSQVTSTIRSYLNTIPHNNSHIEVAFFGGSFTGIDKKSQIAYLEKVQPFIKKNIIKGIRISTRPDLIDTEILTTLKKYNIKSVELGVQSMEDDVLKAAKRGHTSSDIKNASKLIKEAGIKLGHQIMIGLPYSGLSNELRTAKKCVHMGASEVRIYPVIVIKGTFLEKMWRKKSYTPLSEAEAINRCAKLLLLFEKNDVKVIRCGLHPSPGLISGRDMLAGPFHQAFRQKVESYIYNMLFKKFFSCITNRKPVTGIYFNPFDVSYVIGYRRSNAQYIENLLGQRNIFIASRKTRRGIIKIRFKDGKTGILKRTGI